MTKLRLLEIHNACIPKGPDYLPDELRWIDWDKYPSNSLPAMFEADVLIGLRLRCSRLKQLWEGRTKKQLKYLKYVDLSDSQNLVGTSHLGEACNLEELILQRCTSLVKGDLSIGLLKNLVCLNLAGCEKLRSLPDAIHWESLEVLNLSGCVKLQKFPKIRENMDKLLQLHLGKTAIKELPSSIVHIPNLVFIDLCHCTNLVILPSTLFTLKHLKSLILSGCSKVKKLPEEMGNLECLEELLLDGTAVTELPPSIGLLKKLVCLNLAGCKKLRSLPDASLWESLEVLNLSGCIKVQKFLEIRENMDKLLQLHLGETTIEVLPSSIIHMPNLVLIDLCHCTNLVILPSTFCTLKHLKSLILSGCSKVKKLPEEMGNLECLEELLLDGTVVTELPPTIGYLKNLKKLSLCKSSSQSPTSIFQSLFQLRKRQKTTTSLVLAPIWGLTSLTWLDLNDCNLLEGAIPSDLGSLFSLKKLCLGGNNFENLPSLKRLFQLTHLQLSHCKML
ncbi:hypothetical protein LguiA_007265 [Lonicera macranthoides]